MYVNGSKMERSVDNFLAAIRVARLLRPMLIARRIRAIQVCVDALWRAREMITICFAMASLVSMVAVAIYVDLYMGRFHGCSEPSTPASRCLGVLMTSALNTPRGGMHWEIPSSTSALAKADRLARLPILKPMAWNAAEVVDLDSPLHTLQTIGLIACPFSQGWGEIAEIFMCVKGQGIGDGVDNWFASIPLMIAVMVLHVIVYALLTAVLVRSLRETSGVAFLSSAQRCWCTTVRLVRRSYFVVTLGAQESRKNREAKNLTSWFKNRQTLLLCAVRDVLVVINFFLLLAAGAGGQGSEDSPALRSSAGVVSWSLMIQQLTAHALDRGKSLSRRQTSVVLVLIITLGGVVEVMTTNRVSVVLVLLLPPVVMRLKGLGVVLSELSGIEDILQSFANTLLTVSGVFVLLGSYLIFFAIIGVECFSGTKFADRGITAQSNFDSYFAAFELVIRLALGTPYMPVLRALEVSPPYCTPDASVQGTLIRNAGLVSNKLMIGSTQAFVPKNGDCGGEYAWIYLLALIGVCRVAILPLFAASVLSAVLESIDDQRSMVQWSDIEVFQQVWLQMDKERSGRLPSWKLFRFLESLDAHASVLTTSKGDTMSICKDRNKQEALLRHLASSSCCLSAGDDSNISACDEVHNALKDAIRGKPSAHPSVAVAERGHARFVSYPALLIELIALHAFPHAVEWAGGLSLGPSLHKHVSEVVGLQVSHLVSSLAIIRQALLDAGGREANEGSRPMLEETTQNKLRVDRTIDLRASPAASDKAHALEPERLAQHHSIILMHINASHSNKRLHRVTHSLAAAVNEECKKQFTLADTNGDGFISAEELKACFKKGLALLTLFVLDARSNSAVSPQR